MALPIAEIVDGGALLNMLWASLVAGIGVTLAFSLAIHGTARAVDAGREGRAVEAVLFGVVGALALGAVLAGVVLGVIVMTQK
jgi:hypothetical protein